MAPGGGFLVRAVQYALNEWLVQRLSNSVTFQRFAVRSSKAIEEFAQKGLVQKEEIAENMKNFTSSFREEFSRGFKDPRRGF